MDRSENLMKYVSNQISRDLERGLSHGLGHIERVYRAGIEIGTCECANLEIVKPAALLHDIIRPDANGAEDDHAQKSADYAKNLLFWFGYAPVEIAKIAGAISTHSRTGVYNEPKTLEAKVLYDADKQDGVGTDGISRTIALGQKRGWDVSQTAEWYLKRIVDVLKNRPLYTTLGNKMMKDKLPISLDFCKTHLRKKYFEILENELGDLLII